MAEFSTEYYQNEGLTLPGDFSIIQEFNMLKTGESSLEICEGFGITQILNIDDECWVEINGTRIIFSDLLSRN